jgi:hypothetical protein
MQGGLFSAHTASSLPITSIKYIPGKQWLVTGNTGCMAAADWPPTTCTVHTASHALLLQGMGQAACKSMTTLRVPMSCAVQRSSGYMTRQSGSWTSRVHIGQV